MKNELRIGNLVSLSLLDGSLTQDVFINEKQLIGIITGRFIANPVLITEDKLIMFGFRVNENNRVFNLAGIEVFLRTPGSLADVEIEYGHHSEGGEELEHIKYVHQLQNLFYSIENRELVPTSPAPSINPDIAQAIEK